jgi:hypothetical protein
LNQGVWRTPQLNRSLGQEETKKAQLTQAEKDDMFMHFGKGAFKQRDASSSVSQQKEFSLFVHSKLKTHEKVKSMVFDD